jgi:hypothetical protein
LGGIDGKATERLAPLDRLNIQAICILYLYKSVLYVFRKKRIATCRKVLPIVCDLSVGFRSESSRSQQQEQVGREGGRETGGQKPSAGCVTRCGLVISPP